MSRPNLQGGRGGASAPVRRPESFSSSGLRSQGYKFRHGANPSTTDATSLTDPTSPKSGERTKPQHSTPLIGSSARVSRRGQVLEYDRMKRRASLALVVAALAVAALALRAGVAANPTIVVNSAADVHDANPGDGVCETASGNGICTLRAAIEEANALAGADTITFSSSLSSPTTFLLSLGKLPITTDLTITGKGESNTVIDASGDITPDRGFLIQGGTAISVTISGVT